mgnify:CR=1 FL=1
MLPDVTDDRVLKFDYRGAPQTVGLLRRAALESQEHIALRKLAELWCGGLDSKDYVSEYLACNYGCLQRTRYMRDPRTVEFVRAPYLIAQEILSGGRPSLDCDDYTSFLCGLCLAMGGQCRIVTVAFRKVYFQGRIQYSHVFMQAREPSTGVWITLDPVAAENTSTMLKRKIVAAATWPVA